MPSGQKNFVAAQCLERKTSVAGYSYRLHSHRHRIALVCVNISRRGEIPAARLTRMVLNCVHSSDHSRDSRLSDSIYTLQSDRRRAVGSSSVFRWTQISEKNVQSKDLYMASILRGLELQYYYLVMSRSHCCDF